MVKGSRKAHSNGRQSQERISTSEASKETETKMKCQDAVNKTKSNPLKLKSGKGGQVIGCWNQTEGKGCDDLVKGLLRPTENMQQNSSIHMLYTPCYNILLTQPVWSKPINGSSM